MMFAIDPEKGVFVPCGVCATEEAPDARTYDGADAPLALNLVGADAKRYDATPTPTPTRDKPKQPDSRSVATPSPYRKVHGGRRQKP